MPAFAAHAKIRQSPLTRWLVGCKDCVDYLRSMIRRNGAAPSPLSKRFFLLNVLRESGIGTVVESGTFLGDTAHFLSRRGFKITTIELDPALAANARIRFARDSNVEVLEGDSGQMLDALLPRLETPTLFYLDGHYSGPGTALGRLETPVMQEVAAIISGAPAGSVVVIDDARCFGSGKDFPSLQTLFDVCGRAGIGSPVIANDAIRFDLRK